MKQIVTGILAHVDAGKTTLSEAMLYLSGTIRTHGRVDHRNSFLDTNEIEREKGITIFSKQALLTVGDTRVTLLDTPGHIDFSTETERTMSVLDCCILVISGTDGVENHTKTLWKLLERYNVPTFVFINKMDISEIDRNALLSDLQKTLHPNCVDMDDTDALVMCSEEIMNEYIKNDTVSVKAVADAIENREVFPCFFGSALKMTGVDKLLSAIDTYTKMPPKKDGFGAKVFKITRDSDGTRLTHMKITGGTLSAKDKIKTDNEAMPEKVNTIRLYSGDKFTLVDKAVPGMVCAITGLEGTFSGMGLGFESNSKAPVLEPVLTYKLEILDDTDVHTALMKLRILEQEEPELHIIRNELLREIHLQLMGEVQVEVLERILLERFGMRVCFSEGAISYRETIANKVEGVGHFEPLRHYSEVHLILEPLKPGSGVVIKSDCSEDVLDRNWQRLILTHLKEKVHLGVLTGSPITDIKITLASGKAHKKHTEGGDFRQSTYRAVRHGLMRAKSVLLEPYYTFELSVPTENVGRAMTDLQNMGAEFSSPVFDNEMSRISGSAPMSEMRDYHRELVSYTSGKGRLFTSIKGYFPCHNADDVIESIGYDPQSDTENPCGSVFCSHGAGFNVSWDKVEEYMHLESALTEKKESSVTTESIKSYVNSVINDEELLRIFEMTYGPVKVKNYNAMEKRVKPSPERKPMKKAKINYDSTSYLLIDGYNIIFAWADLSEMAKNSLDLARETLINRLCNYRGFTNSDIILVFDAYRVKGGVGSVEHINNIDVVYTKEAETADAYIEKVTHHLAKNHRVRVATSDGLEQIIILGNGAVRVSATELLAEISDIEQKIRDFIKDM